MKGKTFGVFVSLAVVFWIPNFELVCTSHHATCDRTYSKFDCINTYQNHKRIYNELIVTDRDLKSSKGSGIPTDWFHWEEYLFGLVCRCLEKLNRLSEGNLTIYNQFTIQNYGECWSSRNGYGNLHSLTRSNHCVGAGYRGCEAESMDDCTGTLHASFLYRIHNRTRLLDEHCHVVRRLVCPSSALVINGSSSTRFMLNTTSQYTPSRTESPTTQTTVPRPRQSTTKKFSKTDSILHRIKTVNTRGLYAAGSRLPNVTLAPTQFRITSVEYATGTAVISTLIDYSVLTILPILPNSSRSSLSNSPESKFSAPTPSKQGNILTESSIQAPIQTRSISEEISSVEPTTISETATQLSSPRSAINTSPLTITSGEISQTMFRPNSSATESSMSGTMSGTLLSSWSSGQPGLNQPQTNTSIYVPSTKTPHSNAPVKSLTTSSLEIILSVSHNTIEFSESSTSSSRKALLSSSTDSRNTAINSLEHSTNNSRKVTPSLSTILHNTTIEFSETSTFSSSRDLPTPSKVLSIETQSIIIESSLESATKRSNGSTRKLASKSTPQQNSSPTEDLLSKSSFSKSIEDSSNAEQTSIISEKSNYSSMNEKTRGVLDTSSQSTHASNDIFASSTWLVKKHSSISTTQIEGSYISPKMLVNVSPTSSHQSSQLVRDTSSDIQESLTRKIKPSYETTQARESESEHAVSQTGEKKTNSHSTALKLPPSYSQSLERSSAYSQTNALPSKTVTKSLNFVTSAGKKYTERQSSSVASGNPPINCKNTARGCESSAGKPRLSTVLLCVIQLMLIRFVVL